ncbi:MAG: DUF389 domain-containing protein [Flavobacteriales bacterium]|jgi:uncharacterized hydrophobic protein (TIGR00271 family)|nr:DUF389 domain-containing protein [Flavobacteriales bacterium]MBK6550543.1 DUF389 domain-containing protein [Flavobacteriales bacterium]MBK6882900.1 DUF389 domain-containing protein [Flavobacteriales bacterium]MBK7101888.1 DUF389 domain-containing protein [Flavobacteriales bacterium]MBK7114237.1 DUF389 domain-containing protein [Flavobacteriales bacterium]
MAQRTYNAWDLRFGIWGIRNYYTTLEERAIAGAVISPGYIAMTMAAAGLATAGLLLNSPAAIIGSMCVAPFMAPSRAVCIGTIYRMPQVAGRGLVKQIGGLLLMGSGIAYALTMLLQHVIGGYEITPEIALRAIPTSQDFALNLIIATSAGAAAALALTAEPHRVESPWGQVLDAVIGVEIAVSLLPPAAVVGIGLAFGEPKIAERALLLMLLNIIGLNILGSGLILFIRGIRRPILDLEKSIRSVTAETMVRVPGFIDEGSTIDITLLSKKEALINVVLRRHFGGEVPKTLAETIANDVRSRTGCITDITVDVIPLLVHQGIDTIPAEAAH